MTLQQVIERPLALPAVSRALLCVAFALLLVLPKLPAYFANGSVLLEDDAYYYSVIAQSIVETGRSSFDRQTLTNGYHPLWLAVSVLQHLLIGPSALVAVLIEAALCTAALWLLLGLVERWQPALQTVFATVMFGPVAKLAMTGMEVSLVLFCFSLLLYVLAAEADRERRRPVLVAVVAAMCIGARIDSVVFVVPLLLATHADRGATLRTLSVLAFLGMLYAVANWFIFATPVPVSGSVKSLGGLQINHLLLAQLAKDHWSGALQVLAIFVGTGIGLAMAPPKSLQRSLLLALAIGLVLYTAKLVLMSSWVVWAWYWYPQLLVMIAILLVVLPHLAQRVESLGVQGTAALYMGCLAFAALLAVRPPVDPQFEGVRRLDELAIRTIAPTVAGARIAMGDRAGLFAHLYPGPLTQLEGIVNDKEYLDAVMRREDLRPLLCRRGVRFVVEWNKDLGDYARHDAAIFHHTLTSFPGPSIAVERAHEVAAIRDHALFDPGNQVDTIYVWRLAGCPGAADAR